jgi:dihydroxycyclohexadiene carboxylate dehydrogenase
MNYHGCRRLEDKVAVVTGAAQGIGLAAAQRLGREGAKVVVADKEPGPANDAVASLKAEGIDAVAALGDLATYAGAQEIMRAAHTAFGKIDVLVNNVGGTIWKKPFWHYAEEEIIAEVNRSFWPPMWCCRAVVPYMQEHGGAIVNVGSNATMGIYRIPYSASKGAVVALTTSLAVELADFNIRVNCVAPGNTAVTQRATPRLDRPLSAQEEAWNKEFYDYVQEEGLFDRAATCDEQAAVIAFLASDDSSYVTGQLIDTGRRGMRISKITGKRG